MISFSLLYRHLNAPPTTSTALSQEMLKSKLNAPFRSMDLTAQNFQPASEKLRFPLD